MPLKLPVAPFTNETFAGYLRRVRRMKDEPQSVLTPILGSQAAASRIEHGRQPPPPETHDALASYLGLPLVAVSSWLEREALVSERAKLTQRLAEVDARLAEISPRRRR